jgi:adenylate kinase
MNKHLTLIFIGRSGCGKGTQAKLLIDELKRKGHPEDKILSIETGAFIEADHMAAQRARQIMERGALQPSFLAVTMWSNVLIEELRPEHEHVLIDGTPRGLEEAKILDQAFLFFDRPRPIVVHMQVSREWSRERLLARKRTDDARPGDIEQRQVWFERDVMPVIAWYRTNPDYQFVEVNGEQSVEAVHQTLVQAIDLNAWR